MVDKNRTRDAIFAALVELVETTPLDKVSVRQICDRAQISRQTFYQYYKDKYDVAYSVVNEVIGDYFKRLGTEIGWREAYLGDFKNMERLYPVIRHLAQSDDYNSILRATVRNAQNDIMGCYRRRYGCDPDDLIAFQIKWTGHLGTIVPQGWIEGGFQPCAEEFVDYFLSLIPHELFEALDVPPRVG